MVNILIRCADEQLNDMIEKKFPEQVTLSKIGGIKWYLSRDSLNELFEIIESSVNTDKAEKVDFVSHTECSFYQELGENNRTHIVEDAMRAVGAMQQQFPDLTITGYLYDDQTKNLESIDASSQ